MCCVWSSFNNKLNEECRPITSKKEFLGILNVVVSKNMCGFFANVQENPEILRCNYLKNVL